MAKITIDTKSSFTFRGEEMSVEDALAWIEKNATDEDEETGETNTPDPGYLLVYGVRRMMALHKDGKRYKAGKLATHLYAPRLENVEHAPKALAAAVESIATVEEKLIAEATKPARKERKPRAAKKTKAAPPAKVETKAAPPVKAKPPAVRKATKEAPAAAPAA